MTNQVKKYEQFSKLQVRRIDERVGDRNSLCEAEDEIIEEENPMALLYRYDTMYKPPHRYSTEILT